MNKFSVFVLPMIAIACSNATGVPTDGGDTDSGQDSGQNPADGGTDSPVVTDAAADVPVASVKFADVYSILSSKCGDCHTQSSEGKLRMNTEAAAYSALVGVAAAECSGQTRVVKGDAAGSFLVQTLNGTAGCKVPRMPKSRAPLSATEIATIEAWVNAGAEH